MKTMRCLFCLAVYILCLHTVYAQEVQVPLDEQGRVMAIDAALERELGLFTPYSGFQEARLFQVADTSYVLEVLYRPADQVLRVRETLTAEEVQELRRRVTAQLGRQTVRLQLDQGGRPRLLRQAAFTSLLLYGPAMPLVLGINDTAAGTALYLMTASAGFFVPYFLTRDRPVTHGAATLSRVGAGFGALHGFGLALLIGGAEPSGRAVAGAGAAVSAAEAVLGYQLATRHTVLRGVAETVAVGGYYGTAMGLGLAAILSANVDVEDEAAVEDAIETNIGSSPAWGCSAPPPASTGATGWPARSCTRVGTRACCSRPVRWASIRASSRPTWPA